MIGGLIPVFDENMFVSVIINMVVRPLGQYCDKQYIHSDFDGFGVQINPMALAERSQLSAQILVAMCVQVYGYMCPCVCVQLTVLLTLTPELVTSWKQ